MKNSAKRKRIINIERMLAILYVILCVVIAIFFYYKVKNIYWVVCLSLGLCVLGAITAAVHLLDDHYISSIVEDLSELTDTLMELQEKEVFDENEDNLVSKLQTKVIKLSHIMKMREMGAKENQEQVKALVSDISHQLKTPLSNLQMYSSFLKEETLPEEKKKECLNVLTISIERLQFLSESMIKVSRLESGLIHMHPESGSINETVLMAIKQCFTLAKQKNVEICYEAEQEISVYHDRNWTAEAVFNLLDNAVKYAEEQTRVVVRVQMLGMFVKISVLDQNTPIIKEEQSKVFLRFYRGNNSKQKQGVGIGLYLTRQIASMQGGYVNLTVHENGNEFALVLYCKDEGTCLH